MSAHKATALANPEPAMLAVLKYGGASRIGLDPLATLSARTFRKE
jgi:hypothetical protein